MIKHFVKILELLGDRLEVCVSVVKTQLKCCIMSTLFVKVKKWENYIQTPLDIYNGPFQRYYVNPITNIQVFINFQRLKFIVSIQKHEFINLQKVEVYHPET